MSTMISEQLQSGGGGCIRRHRPAAFAPAEGEPPGVPTGCVRPRTRDPRGCRGPVPHEHPRQGHWPQGY